MASVATAELGELDPAAARKRELSAFLAVANCRRKAWLGPHARLRGSPRLPHVYTLR